MKEDDDDGGRRNRNLPTFPFQSRAERRRAVVTPPAFDANRCGRMLTMHIFLKKKTIKINPRKIKKKKDLETSFTSFFP